MDRKSRKNIVVSTKSITKKYSAAAYARISVQKTGQPSDSIEGQLHLIDDFILQQDVMELAGCYIDENESGTSFQRKGFQKMLDDIAAGKINCVIVKDLSRFGRNFVETGFYLEQFFPLKRVRFISINDGWDSVDGVTNQNPLGKSSGVIPLTNYINEAFVEDIYRKTQSSIDLCMEQGGFIAPRAPYGYQKSADNCHQLIVDPVAADVVRHIFILADQLEGLTEIVRKLNAEKVLPPISYAIANGLQGNYNKGNGLWNTRSVKKILMNRTYTGVLIQGKDKKCVEGTHEAIVEKKLFERIQSLLGNEAQAVIPAPQFSENNILKGKVFCGNCGGKLQRKHGTGNADWYFFTCITKNRMGKEHCLGMYIRESTVMSAIRAEIFNIIKNQQQIMSYERKEQRDLECEISWIEQDNCIQSIERQKIYEDMVMGKLTKEEAISLKAALPDFSDELLQKKSNLEQRRITLEQFQMFCNAEKEQAVFKKLVSRYLLKVTVFTDKNMIVEFDVK